MNQFLWQGFQNEILIKDSNDLLKIYIKFNIFIPGFYWHLKASYKKKDKCLLISYSMWMLCL
jgi:hypothetical protein